ncbi:hypothetical protein cand_014090 [Cryptosporidium andersoni]|uniref:SET domain-containing protein n=1 Tax=Cryptosporidium andersoni TaxID=117008 RepID=A0A1J4MU50_9CRYT|nr:hypothetical protein cand_014090 [Cryptosporidium andersoni]
MAYVYESSTKLRPVADFNDDRWVALSTAEFKRTLIDHDITETSKSSDTTSVNEGEVSIYPEALRYHFKDACSFDERVEETEFGFVEEVEEQIQPWDISQIDEHVEIRVTKDKGRCLYARKSFNPGDIIFAENPILVVTPDIAQEMYDFLEELNESETFSLPPLWHLAALCTLTMLDEETKQACLDKWVPDPYAEPSHDVIKVIENSGLDIDPYMYERTLGAWRYNSFNHTSNNGIVLYNRISMMAHSCAASCCWHYGIENTFVLRAKTRLEIGDEITISYIADDDLFKCSKVRRNLLLNWLFYCQCSRCSDPVDLSRGLRCASCGVGTVFFKDNETGETLSTSCNVCKTCPHQDIILSYTDLESQYILRLEETDKTDIEDIENVYIEAQKVFTQHWIMYELDTMLFEAYKDIQQYDNALPCLYNRLNYVRSTFPDCTYTLAWITEELGDILSIQYNENKLSHKSNHQLAAIQRNFYDTWCYLSILTGPNHHFTNAAKLKYEATCE